MSNWNKALRKITNLFDKRIKRLKIENLTKRCLKLQILQFSVNL